MTLDELRRAAARLGAERALVDSLEAEVASLVRRALREGVRAVEVADAAGITRARVYQIRSAASRGYIRGVTKRRRN